MENSPTVKNVPSGDPINRVIAPIARFLHVEAAGGAALLAATVIALTLANSSAFGESYLAIWNTPVEFGFGTFKMSDSLTRWINEGLMALFFFVIGLEVKCEIVARRAARHAEGYTIEVRSETRFVKAPEGLRRPSHGHFSNEENSGTRTRVTGCR